MNIAFHEWQAADITPPDIPALREYRLSKIKGELARKDYSRYFIVRPNEYALCY